MKRLFSNIILVCILFSSCEGDRVAKAYNLTMPMLTYNFKQKNLVFPPTILIQAFKAEGELDIWARDSTQFKLFKTYKICRISGGFGRKLKEGDKQVPEGFYFIEKFNPKSSYHLSLGINYPNEADRFVADSLRPGGDIYIHGDCVSVGCMAMTDEQIKEIYVLASEAKKNGQSKIPVNIYPFRMTAKNFTTFTNRQPEWKPFWQSLKNVHDSFEKNHIWQEPNAVNGEYILPLN